MSTPRHAVLLPRPDSTSKALAAVAVVAFIAWASLMAYILLADSAPAPDPVPRPHTLVEAP